MPNQPTQGTQPAEVLGEFKGLNDQSDSVKRPAGTVSDMRNMYDEQAMDAARRPGRIFSSLNDGNPIGTIYQLSWPDGSITNVSQNGSSFSFDDFSNYQSGSISGTLENPCPDGPITTCPDGSNLQVNSITGENFCADNVTDVPICPPAVPTGPIRISGPKPTPKPVPDFVPLIRALAEAYYFANKSRATLGTLPNQVVGVDFYTKTQPRTKVTSSPARTKQEYLYWLNRGFIPRRASVAPINPEVEFPDLTTLDFDHYYVDYVVQGPGRFAQDLNTLTHIYNSQILTSYLKTDPDSNPSTLANYTSLDAYTFSASAANYKQVCAQFAGVVNANLRKVKVAATQSSLQSKTGTAQDSGPVDCGGYSVSPTTVFISGYSSGFWNTSGCGTGCDCGSTIPSGGADPYNCCEVSGQLDSLNLVDDCSFFDQQYPYGVAVCPDQDPDLSYAASVAGLFAYAGTNADFGGHSINTSDGFTWDFQVSIPIPPGEGCDTSVDGWGADVLWSGTMTTVTQGDCRGVYTRTGGCDLRATITIV